MKCLTTLFRFVLASSCLWTANDSHAAVDGNPGTASYPKPPGVIVDHSPARSGLYVGSASLTVLTNGDYLASHDLFGPRSAEFERPNTLVFRSRDRGRSWSQVARVAGAFWSNLFVHRGAAYLMGTDRHHGRIVIRRSIDNGDTWTDPQDELTGLLVPTGQYHTAPMPMVEHRGRLWRAFEDAMGGTEWGKRYRAGVLSIAVDADLLQATNWCFSTFLPRDPGWLDGRFNAWLEGNVVIDRDGNIVNLLRVDTPNLPEMAARVDISPDGREARFNPTAGFLPFPGGAKKFVIRFDKPSDKYWALGTPVMDTSVTNRPGSIRNCLALLSSSDLRSWKIQSILLRHPDVARHGFQYPDWHVEGEDLIAVVRTAFDDDEGGAKNNHDANYLTFHRFTGFRKRTLEDSPASSRKSTDREPNELAPP